MDYEKIKAAAAGYQADMTRFLRAMIARPSESCQEEEVVACIKAELEKLGYDQVEVDGLGNVIGWLGRGDRIIAFCNSEGLALYDTALEVRRLADNASDKFLEVVTPVDIRAMLDRMPECTAIISTGEKASGIIAGEFGCPVPKVGNYVELPRFPYAGRTGDDEKSQAGKTPAVRFYRLPSSSRAYPLALDRKIQAYSILKGLLLPAE